MSKDISVSDYLFSMAFVLVRRLECARQRSEPSREGRKKRPIGHWFSILVILLLDEQFRGRLLFSCAMQMRLCSIEEIMKQVSQVWHTR